MSDEMLETEWDEAYAAGVADAIASMRQPGRVNELLAEAREQAIRDCIAAVDAISDDGDTDTRYILASTVAALRALLEGEGK